MSNKWCMVILLKMEEAGGTCRFGDLFRSVPFVSEKMLSSSLRSLCEDGLIFRKSLGGLPPHVEYGLAPLALSLLPLIHQLNEWGHNHFKEIMRNRQRYAETKRMGNAGNGDWQ